MRGLRDVPAAVLLVEDDSDNRDLMREILEGMGLEVQTAGTARDALAAASGGSFDVVITDVGLPDMGGIELARALRRQRPSQPVVVVTGFDLKAEAREGFAVLLKPIEPSVLERTLARLLARPEVTAEV
jgi:CheY-like chemotaxis protein